MAQNKTIIATLSFFMVCIILAISEVMFWDHTINYDFLGFMNEVLMPTLNLWSMVRHFMHIDVSWLRAAGSFQI